MSAGLIFADAVLLSGIIGLSMLFDTATVIVTVLAVANVIAVVVLLIL